MNWLKYGRELLLSLLLFAIGFVGFALIGNWYIADHPFSINEVESNLFFINENEKFDLVILGISHARNFSRQANHEISERILNKKILNLGRGNGLCGLYGQQLYLDFFFEKGNTTNEVLLVASPPLLYGLYLDENQAAYRDEPIRYDFSKFILKKGNSTKRWQLFQSFVGKLRPNWLDFKKYKNEPIVEQLAKVDSLVIKEGMQRAYPKGRTTEMLDRNIRFFKKIIASAKINGAKIKVVISPTTFGKWPGHQEVLNYFQKVKAISDFEIIDLSESIFDKSLYYDHHHLNSSGVEFFWKNYLSESEL